MDQVEITTSPSQDGLDLRELTFQNVINNILRPAGIKMGGFPEHLFMNLTDQEQQQMMCNICFLIANDCRLCDNDHVFCQSCALAWSLTFSENAHKCPVCRCTQMDYNRNDDLQRRICSKQVRCLEHGCDFESTLGEYLLHDHGKSTYSNAEVDFIRLRQQLRAHSLPTANSNSPTPTSIRSQLLQSQTMIQQMMMLMRVEMQLRQQALISFQQTVDGDVDRRPRLDDAVALNEQLSEISSVLSSLLGTTARAGSGARRRSTLRSDLSGSGWPRRVDGPGVQRSTRRVNNWMAVRQWRDLVADDDSSFEDENNADSADDDNDDDEIFDLNDRATSAELQESDELLWREMTAADSRRTSPDGASYDPFSSPSISYQDLQITPRYVLQTPDPPQQECNEQSSLSSSEQQHGAQNAIHAPEQEPTPDREDTAEISQVDRPFNAGSAAAARRWLVGDRRGSSLQIGQQANASRSPPLAQQADGAHGLLTLGSTVCDTAQCRTGSPEPGMDQQQHRNVFEFASLPRAVFGTAPRTRLEPSRPRASTVDHDVGVVSQSTTMSSVRPLLSPPGSRIPPYFLSYAATRLRQQASNQPPQPPSSTASRPEHSSVGNPVTSPAPDRERTRGLGPAATTSSRQPLSNLRLRSLPTYASVQSRQTRPARPSLSNKLVRGDDIRMPPP